MKRFITWMGILSLLTSFLTSCKDDKLPTIDPDDIRLRFSIVTTEEGLVNTRASEDQTINSIYVLVFEGNEESSKLKDWAAATVAGESTYYATLKENTTAGTMYVFANIETSMAGGTDFTENITLGELKSKMIVQLPTKDGLIIQDPHFAPMVSDSHEYDRNSPDEPTFQLTRATAKVTVKNKSANPHYEMQGSNLGNAPTQGTVFANIKDISTIAHYAGPVSAGDYSVDHMMRGVSDDKSTTEPLYMFESPETNETFVIIKGVYDGVTGYHRLNLWNRTDKKFLQIKRNYQYIINIGKIVTCGYSTASEAIKNPASNRDIDYEIDVVDPSSHDIISNGEQYLGVSNSALIIYKTGDLNGIVATKISYTTSPDWTSGTITAIGEGLTLSKTNSKSQPMNSGPIKDLEIKINCSPAFQSGSLVLHIGDLAKVITITRNSNLSAIPEEMEFKNLIVGDCSESGAMKSYIRFSGESSIYGKHETDIFTSSTGDLYTLVSANVGYRDLKERDGEFYVSSARDGGRTKVTFHQNKLNVYDDLAQIEPFTYIGTFHRWNQTAERIIRIKTINTDANSHWTAIVIAGDDFIEMDTERSPDTGITMYPYGCDNIENPTDIDHANWTTDDEIEANCQLSDGKIRVSGSGVNIYFRVGLKSKLSGAAAQPRYGLIAVIHKGGNHLIYVRQGEEADYVMRPTDPMPNILATNRPDAVKISPYNLTVPDDKKVLKFYDVPQNGGVWTDYPSQGGYLFMGTSRRAYAAVGATKNDINWNLNKEWPLVEICPSGFRRPNDGVHGNTGIIEGSEMRQSFWLNPQIGVANSNLSNIIRGYIADGYFDRHPMRIPNTQGRTNEGEMNIFESITTGGKRYKVPSLVGDGAYAGYAGALIYNPFNYASIFCPATGYRDFMGGRLMSTGINISLWSSTSATASNIPVNMYYIAIGYVPGKGEQYIFDNYSSTANQNAFSLRGVKE